MINSGIVNLRVRDKGLTFLWLPICNTSVFLLFRLFRVVLMGRPDLPSERQLVILSWRVTDCDTSVFLPQSLNKSWRPSRDRSSRTHQPPLRIYYFPDYSDNKDLTSLPCGWLLLLKKRHSQCSMVINAMLTVVGWGTSRTFVGKSLPSNQDLGELLSV